jgi:predicted esterase YcpF (UPF0227 family)
MSIRYDEEGKIFTNIIPKEILHAVIQTVNQRILGNVYVRPEDRLKDELNRAEQFLAVTDAVVMDQAGLHQLYECGFLAVNRDHIVWLMPTDEIRGEQSREKAAGR